MRAGSTLVVAIVGVDGCGKSTAWRGLLAALAGRMPVTGIGEEVLMGAPGRPLRPGTDLRGARITAAVARTARRTRRPGLYRQLKLLDLSCRARLRDAVADGGAASVLVTDGDPLINATAWSAASYYRAELEGDDHLHDMLRYLCGEADIPFSVVRRHARQTWQLALMNRLRLVRFALPDLVILLRADGSLAMEHIRARGRPLQAHESEGLLDRLDTAYERVCRLVEERFGVPVVRIAVRSTPPAGVVAIAREAVMSSLAQRDGPDVLGAAPGDAIDIVATTMSGSIRDQRKVGRIGPAFRARTGRPVRVHVCDSHAEARRRAHDVVVASGRTLVSAGGAGTFNAVLEGSHVDGDVPADLRLAFLRKGSADLIGKVLHVPDDLDEAAEAIVGGLEAAAVIPADVLAVRSTAGDGGQQVRHLVGFGGLETFGDVPRFTETRLVKAYKGILGTLLGDYGPFFVGLALAALRWQARRLLGRVAPLVLTLDEAVLPAMCWRAVVIVNGDLGPDFPLGRGLPLDSGTFRVVALRDVGLRRGIGQLQACRSAEVLDVPERWAAVVREVTSLTARPAGGGHAVAMVNVDGLRMPTRGEVAVEVSGRIGLVEGRRASYSLSREAAFVGSGST